MNHELTSEKFDKKDDTLCDKIHKADFFTPDPFLSVLALELWKILEVEWNSQISLWMNLIHGYDSVVMHSAVPSMFTLADHLDEQLLKYLLKLIPGVPDFEFEAWYLKFGFICHLPSLDSSMLVVFEYVLQYLIFITSFCVLLIGHKLEQSSHKPFACRVAIINPIGVELL